MIISNSHKFIFVHIHKTGGSSLSAALQPSLAWNDLSLGGSPHGEAMNAYYDQEFGLNKHSTLEEIKVVCGAELVENYFSFTLVRDPVTRAVSLYNYIAGFSRELARFYGKTEPELATLALSEDSSIDHNFFGWSATQAYYLTASFSAFIRHTKTQTDMGFRPQIDSLKTAEGERPIDKIIKLEALTTELPELWKALGFRFLLPHINRATTYFQTVENLSRADKAYLRALFAEDCQALEY